MKTKKYNKILKRLTKLNTFDYVVFVVISWFLFTMGWHNLDYSQNMMRLNTLMWCVSDFNENTTEIFTDIDIAGREVSYQHGYRLGSAMVLFGAYAIMVSTYYLVKNIRE